MLLHELAARKIAEGEESKQSFRASLSLMCVCGSHIFLKLAVYNDLLSFLPHARPH